MFTVATAGQSSKGMTLMVTKARRDLAEEMYPGCLSNGTLLRQARSSLHSTWFSVLHGVFRYTDSKLVKEEHWVGALAAAILSNGIECMPGSRKSRLTVTGVVRLVGHIPSMAVLRARPGSLKRAAIEATWRGDQPAKQRRIDFGCEIPFKGIPELVEKGFRKNEQLFRRGNVKVLEHYEIARHSLEQCLGDPLCDVLLMMVLTFASSSVTPAVAVKEQEFSVGQKRDGGLVAANLATRMLWFLRPEHFPWDQDDGVVLRVSEMTKKIGKCWRARKGMGQG